MLSNLKRNKAQYKLMDILGYFGNNDSAVEILADTESQLDGYTNDKMSDFSVKRILWSLNYEQISKVLSFFGVTEKVKNGTHNLSLVLTQHMANLGIMPLEEQHLLYKLLADYFLADSHIVVKPHPDDIAGRYGEIFGSNATVLPFAMPSELLAYTFDGKIKTAIAANSTAVKNLGDICDKMICFDNRILTDFKYIHRYYAAIMLIAELGGNKDKITTNANEVLFEELSRTENLDMKFDSSDEITDIDNFAVISDNLLLECSVENICNFLTALKTAGFIVLLNEENKHIYFDGINTKVFRYIRPILITSIDKKGNKKEDVIYLYSTDSKILKATENFELKKEMKYTGVTLDIHSISRSESEKIKMLEGVLEATEVRLKEYISNKKQLDEEIAKLKRIK